ncbi:hypothetical protein L1049_022779 [Liquidambar formosana]|uniref:Myb-like domain-containing protein n=1 Tax=Liquidambar formosana TaxID=63359 RepID=A0AAP0WP62_LIQFO
MQQGGSQYGVSPEMAPFAAASATRTQMLGSTDHTQQQAVPPEAEAASPISSRPPAHSSAGNFDELLPGPGDDDALIAGDETDRGGISGGNRWPRQETLALLKIRSEMDVAFRDATLKGPLWEEVSRKLAELGYTRSAKKCKEKFENVHKYYKRTKEGRAGRQDGKSYRFFTQLEALHSSTTSTSSSINVSATAPTNAPTTATTTHLVVTPVSIGIGNNSPMPVSSGRIPPSISATPSQAPPMFIPDLSVGTAPAMPGSTTAQIGISFSSNSSSSSSSGSSEEDEEEGEEGDEDELEGEPSNTHSSRGRKRKRKSSKGAHSSSRRMMEFFESLMKQVMQKQEVMQQRFLETIEKREQDRMIREEAWKRQEMTRLAREHDLMAQDRAISASRDAAIISFLQKITGQTIQLPPSVPIPAAPPPPPAPVPPPQLPQQQHHLQQQQQQQQQQQKQQKQQQQQQQQQQLHHHQSQINEVSRRQPSVSSELVVAVPEQQVPPQEMGGGGSFDLTSSRWPKAEVLALIKLRSGLEARYQEAGPKGPLWEEISAGMQRMGYKRSAKRCKEKWENINKYFKKVKESNKKRPEDAKTCPYFHQLDALYQKKILGSSSGGGGGSSSSSFGNQNRPEQQQQESMKLDPIPPTQVQDSTEVPAIIPAPQMAKATESENKNGDTIDVQASNGGLPVNLFGEGNSSAGGVKKPEDIVKELMGQQPQQRESMMDNYDKMEEPDSDNLDDQEEDEDDDEESGDDGKLAYKIEFQRQNAGSSNGGGNGATSFVAMVQ